ncbi:lysine--tRNA ligase [Candidatus Jorgensenbacteria bacterium GWA1_54_12]|uniref:Lysine--tRNA ligase n=1 Tax=Candidatus Jorgensenbacteria bacterium GWA1_54_12 TaxID=1798468 RepID=A0A1F6BIR8_9BACT|nr:MAG: lysine--tRNA ligase [Candidatus Jorgensenbacteria bacterium GWA1_54_12]
MREDLASERRKKLLKYGESAPPYPARVRRSAPIETLVSSFRRLGKKSVAVTGRVWSVRDQGKIWFLDVKDETGVIQVILSKGDTAEFELLSETLDRGDFIEAQGKALTTKRGEKSIAAQHARIIAKALRPLPTEWYGLEDVETRLRKRYLDVLFNPEVKELLLKKAVFWDAARSFLKKAEFTELEMPVLEAVPGGAEAEPFITHYRALDEDLYMRISLELPLKKMLVGGFEKIFEIGKIFRNEGIDAEHLQDYTQMECYAAYWDYNDMMRFTEKLVKQMIRKTFGTLKMKTRNHTISWSEPFARIEYADIFEKETGLNPLSATEAQLREKARALGVAVESHYGKGRLIDLVYKKAVRGKLVKPCFLINPPVEVEPLAKRMEEDPRRVERFQIVAAGTEMGKGFSELNDPIDQRERFEEQMRLRAKGDREAQQIDEEFLTAMEYGMPPAAGFGMSERLFAVLAGVPVRETVAFPLMKKAKN